MAVIANGTAFHGTSRPAHTTSVPRTIGGSSSSTGPTAEALGRTVTGPDRAFPIRAAVSPFWAITTVARCIVRRTTGRAASSRRVTSRRASSPAPLAPRVAHQPRGTSTAPPTGPHTNGLSSSASPVLAQ